MKWKTTAFLLVATVGVGAFISLYEIRRQGTDERARKSRQLLNIPPESVSQIDIQHATATLSLTRDGEQWRLGPQRVRANADLVGELLSETSSLTAQRTFSESPEKPLDLKAFGLDPGLARITLTSDDSTTTLLIGEKTPVHTNRYAKRADQPDVAVISPTLFDIINQPAESFRDPMLLRFDTWMTDAVTITTPERVLALTRESLDWRLTQPVNDRADRSAVTNVLNGLAGLRIARVVEDAPQAEQLTTWGFDAPRVELALIARGDPPFAATVFFGKPLPEDGSLLYAKRSDEPALYAIEAASVDALLQDPNSLRATACLEFFTSEVTKIEVVHGETGWLIERKDDAWRLVSDTKAAAASVASLVSDTKLDTPFVEAFLKTLADLWLIEFVDEQPTDLARYGLEPPQGTISVWTTNPDAPMRLLVGTTIEGSTYRFGRIDGREPVVTLPEAVTTLLATPLEHLRPPPETPPQAPPQPAQTPSAQ